jgi:hypothetical protein
MKRTRTPQVLSVSSVLALAASVVACTGSSSSTDPGTQASALQAAQESYATFAQQAKACAQTLDTCLSAPGADAAACKAQFEQCLPDDPPPGSGCGHWGDGGAPNPLPEAGAFDHDDDGGPGDDDDGGDHDGHHGHRHHHGHCGHVPLPGGADLAACRTAFEACVQSGTDHATCEAGELTCVQGAFQKAFQALCAQAQSACAASSNAECGTIATLCAQGI